ncbi:hypothetical protein D3C80_1641040 [compost metagenome]
MGLGDVVLSFGANFEAVEAQCVGRHVDRGSVDLAEQLMNVRTEEKLSLATSSVKAGDQKRIEVHPLREGGMKEGFDRFIN